MVQMSVGDRIWKQIISKKKIEIGLNYIVNIDIDAHSFFTRCKNLIQG